MTYEEANKKMKELLDQPFLDKLAEIGRLYGWSGDYHEIGDFIENLHYMKNVEEVNLDPYVKSE